MLKKIILNFVVILLAIFFQSCSKQPSEAELQQLALQYFEYLSDEDFESAAVLFHYPSKYTQEELAKDKISISQVLNLFNNEFGEILDKKCVDSVDNYLFVVVFGGDIPYWEKHSQSFAVFYDVEFAREGNGHIILHFCNINSKWEIQKVLYCLPKSRPDSLSRINEIGGKIMKLFELDIELDIRKKDN